jgi:hypothetical protein
MGEISDETKVGFQRVELLTGPSRRRRWSAEEKAGSFIVSVALSPHCYARPIDDALVS